MDKAMETTSGPPADSGEWEAPRVLPPAVEHDEAARAWFSDLYVEYFSRLDGFFTKRHVPDFERPELTQRTLFRVYRSGGRFEEPASVEKFVFTVATNVWKSWLEERQRRGGGAELANGSAETDAADQELEQIATPEPDARDRLLLSERQEGLRVAIDSLPPQMRRCMMLRIYQERSYEEIASLLRMPVNTVKSHLGQARIRLRNKVGERYGKIEL